MVKNKFHRILEVIAYFFFLNMLWILFSLPIITVFASTAAMFGVIRKSQEDGINLSVLSDFPRLFKENFKQSTIIGFIWSIVGFSLYFYLFFFSGMEFEIIKGLLLLMAILFILHTVYLLPVIVHYKLTVWKVFSFSIIYSIRFFGSTFIALCIIGAGFIVFYKFPMTLLFIISICAYHVYHTCAKSFNKVANVS
ncbi:MAG: DUF624 domain-containing protein [Bacillaceae bacterium]|nr:DUF624 domain-containing protein [Bacillaceae bacterium]